MVPFFRHVQGKQISLSFWAATQLNSDCIKQEKFFMQMDYCEYMWL